MLRFADDVNPNDITAHRQGDDLIFSIQGTQDATTVKGYYQVTRSTYSIFYGTTYYYDNQLTQIQFADGTTWTPSTIPFGDAGSNTYTFGHNAGAVRIVDYGPATTTDTLAMNADVTPAEVILRGSTTTYASR